MKDPKVHKLTIEFGGQAASHASDAGFAVAIRTVVCTFRDRNWVHIRIPPHRRRI